jgi:uncharacterized membrane protein YccC
MEAKDNQKTSLRSQGGYLVLGGILFALKWGLGWSDTFMEFLVFVVSLTYVFIFQETDTQPQSPLAKRLFRLLLSFIGLVIVVALLALFAIWFSGMTGIPSLLLIAIGLTLAGLILIALSYRKVNATA